MAHRTVTGAAIVHPDPGDTDALAEAFEAKPSPNSIWLAAARREPRIRLTWRLFAGMLLLVVCIAAALWFTRPAAAQQVPPWMGPPPCAPYDEIVGRLASEYHETIVFMGLTSQGSLMQLFASDEGDTWTIVDVKPKGEACVVVGGKGFEARPVGQVTAFNKIARRAMQ